jgi:hypothetical protein
VADYDKVIPPGKEGKVNIRIDGKKLTNAGRFDKSFTVRTNDPANPEFVLVAHGTIQKVFDLSGEMRLMGFTDEKLHLELGIENLLSTPVDITGAHWSPEAVQQGMDKVLAYKLETVEKGKKYRLKVWNKEPLKPQNVLTNIVLTTDNPKLEEKSVPVAVTILNDVELQPDRIIYGEMVLTPGGPTSFDRTFNLVAERGDSLKIIKAVPNRDFIKVSFREVIPGKSFQGTVWVTPGDKIGAISGSIKIYTNYPGYRELDLDVVGSARRAGK